MSHLNVLNSIANNITIETFPFTSDIYV